MKLNTLQNFLFCPFNFLVCLLIYIVSLSSNIFSCNVLKSLIFVFSPISKSFLLSYFSAFFMNLFLPVIKNYVTLSKNRNMVETGVVDMANLYLASIPSSP